MLYDIYHKTSYSYHSVVTFSHNIARLKPVENSSQKLLNFEMQINPQPYESHSFVDSFQNNNLHMLIRESHTTLEIISKSKIEISPEVAIQKIEFAKKNSISYEEMLRRFGEFHRDDTMAKQFLYESELIPHASQAIKDYALKSFSQKRDIFNSVLEFTQRVFDDFEFVSGFSDITTPPEQIFESKKGVCQDFAQFCISALRSIGISAKYMSGYIETVPEDGSNKLFGVDASHAWFAVYIPAVGWVEFDPTNNMLVGNQHILLGSGRDYADISPLKGVVFSSGGSSLGVEVDVRRA